MDGKQQRAEERERGATVVEYALVLSLFVVGTLASLEALHDNTSDFYAESSSGIGAIPTWSLSSTTVTAGGPSATTTTMAPTTTAPATTTTAAPATTTTAAPTTTVAANTTIKRLEDRSFIEGDGDWRARVRIEIHRDDSGFNVGGAVVTGRFTTADGNTRTASCTTASNGKCQIEWGNRKNNDNPTLFEVTSITASPPWDGSTASIVLVKP